MARPAQDEAAAYFFRYIDLAKGESVKETLQNHSEELKTFYSNLPVEKADYAYAPGKWTIKELLQHVIDAERVFVYRALRFARKDATPLHSFDENAFAENSFAGDRIFSSIKDEFNALRLSTDIMLDALNEEQLNSGGTASNNHTTVNAIGFIIYGHLLHPKNILEARYL